MTDNPKTSKSESSKIAPAPLDQPVASLSGIGGKRAELLGNLGIATIRDLLFHFPRSYQDRRRLTSIARLKEGDTATIKAEVVHSRARRLRRRLSATEALLRDHSGEIKAIWFGFGFLSRTLKPGKEGFFTGTVGKWKGLCLRNPDYEVLSNDEEDRLHTGRIVPIYRLTEKISQRMLRRWVRIALDEAGKLVEDRLPAEMRKHWPHRNVWRAIEAVHFPATMEEARKARDRFAYEELLGIQLAILQGRAGRAHEQKGYRHTIEGANLQTLRDSLAFALTKAQERAVADILADMASPRPMVRLLQGDVGCGKTVVALHAVAAASDGGYQTALMAPTEILAEQHALNLRESLEPLGLSVEILTGSTASAAKVRRLTASGDVDVLVGTHALLQEKTDFRNLGLVIIDEQHRFGVVQRDMLVRKGTHPDILHMTATPIPRTLAITVYGGMDACVIDELPPGRQPIKTRRITPAKVADLYAYIVEQAQAGFQTYIVCPLVEESDKRDLTSVINHFKELSAGPFQNLNTGLLHGRMAFREKDTVMHQFKRGEIDVLFTTTVIEVGIDCPNATTIVIEDAPQFGLTQLHQLRGRVGRGSEPSHCFLLGKHKTPEGKKRVEIMCTTNSGFVIAEADLELRGPGEFRGVRQSGMSDLRVADLLRDVRLLDRARREAESILERDPLLSQRDHLPLAGLAQRYGAVYL
ncbi:MAG: ATP-dependent DNA helicase RecG [Candidatus Hydrogenedentota bacterium]